MKKISVVLSILLMFGFTPLKAQFKVLFSKGFEANATMSNFLLKGTNSESRMGFGTSFGSSDKLEFGEYFALQGELLAHYKTSKITDKTNKSERDFSYWGLEVSAYTVGQMKMGVGKGFVGIGSYVGYGLSATSNPEKINLYKTDAESSINRWDFGGKTILGYEFASGFFVNAAYQVGVHDLLTANKNGATMRSQTLSLGLGYRFPLVTVKFDKEKIQTSFF